MKDGLSGSVHFVRPFPDEDPIPFNSHEHSMSSSIIFDVHPFSIHVPWVFSCKIRSWSGYLSTTSSTHSAPLHNRPLPPGLLRPCLAAGVPVPGAVSAGPPGVPGVGIAAASPSQTTWYLWGAKFWCSLKLGSSETWWSTQSLGNPKMIETQFCVSEKNNSSCTILLSP